MKNLGLPLLIFSLLLGCTNNQLEEKETLDLLPPNPVLVLIVKQGDAFNTSLKNQKVIGALKPFANQLLDVKQLQPNKGQQLVGLHQTGKNKLSFVQITEDPYLNLETIDTSYYENTFVRKAIKDNVVYFETKINNHYLLSPSKLLIESSIRARSGKNLSSNKDLKKLQEIHQDTPVQLLVHESLEQYSSLMFKKSPYAFSSLGEWSSYAVQITPRGMQINGLGFVHDSIPRTINLLNTIPHQVLSIDQVVPVGAMSVKSFAFDAGIYQQNVQRFLNAKGLPNKPTTEAWNSITEWGEILGTKDTICVAYADDVTNFWNHLGTTQETQDYRNHEIEKVDSKENKNSLPIFLPNVQVNWATKHENFVILSSKLESLEWVINAIEDGATIASSESFQALKKTLPKKSNFMFLGIQPSFEKLIKEYSDEEISKKLNYKALKKGPFWVLQGILQNNWYQLFGTIEEVREGQNNAQQNVRARFAFTLDSPLTFGPQMVVNHRNKAKEWVVQDSNNNLYLINNDGGLVWKKELDAKIQGEIKQVDLYRNGRLQLAFTTEKSLIVLDRNGKQVEDFSHSFKGAIPLGLSVFDYDKNRDYRLLLSQGKEISMFDRKMKKVKGFSMNSTQELLHAPKHLRIGSKDYLVFIDKNGGLFITDRRGKTRVKPNKKVILTEQDLYKHKNKFVTIDQKQRLITIDQNGSVTEKVLPLETPYMFSASQETLAYLSENKLTINNELIELDFGVYSPPIVVSVDGKTWITVTDLQSQKVYVFDHKGNVAPNFPVFGSGPINLGAGSKKGTYLFGVKTKEDQFQVYQF